MNPTEHGCPTGEHLDAAPRRTPVERLQAAIEKLEAYRSDATQGAWVYDAENGEIHATSDEYTWGSVLVGRLGFHDDWLVVTLHRTIDAQLAILRTALERYARFPPAQEPGWQPKAPGTVDSLALADAILGGTQ